MLTLNDGRTELWQWDTKRKLTVDAECSQVHFSNKVFGRSIDIDVIGGAANIPDILLQTDKDLNAWAFVGTAENGYTKISKTFKVNRRNKPADYVFTPPEQTTLGQIMERLDDLEAMQDPDAIKNAVDDYLANNPIQIDEKDPTVPDWAKQATKPKYTATEVGAVATVNGVKPDGAGNVEIPVGGVAGGGLSTTAANLFIAILREGVYSTNQSGNITALAAELGVTEEVPDIPDEPDEPEKTLTGISATYSGGDVAVGTAVSDLTGISVTAHYSDGTSETVTGYTLSGTIAEGSNTVTVSYGGKTATFTVTGVAESGGDDGKVYITNTLVWEDGYYITNSGTFTESAGKSLSGYVDITGYSNVVFEDTADEGLLSAGASFWTAEKTFISRGGRYYRKSNTNYPSPCVVEIPQNAVYTRLDIGKNDKGKFEVYLM